MEPMAGFPKGGLFFYAKNRRFSPLHESCHLFPPSPEIYNERSTGKGEQG